MSGVAILVTTIDSEAAARDLARAALEARLAACVQILPIRSHYVWKGDYCDEAEFQLQMKHRAQDFAALSTLVLRLHPYETPEILRIDVAETSEAYGQWLQTATSRG